MRIQNILVPVDLSPPSRLALGHGISLARKFRSRLTLLHVMEFPATLTAGFPTVNEKEHHGQALRLLSALVAPEDRDDLDVAIVIKSGEIEEQVFATIADQQADMVVMGTHGRGLFGRLFIGSLTQSVLRRVPIPILTVSRVMRPLTFKRILFATDLSQASKYAFPSVLELAHTMGSDVVVFHAVEPVKLSFGRDEMARYIGRHDIEEAQTKLAGFVSEGACRNIKVETIVVGGHAAKETLKAVEENDIDLIMITIQSKGLIERALVGTSAEEIIREAHLPVLSIPAHVPVPYEQLSQAHSAKP